MTPKYSKYKKIIQYRICLMATKLSAATRALYYYVPRAFPPDLAKSKRCLLIILSPHSSLPLPSNRKPSSLPF